MIARSCIPLSARAATVCIACSRWFLLLAIVLASPVGNARNVILIIGDGMDDQQITIARNYLLGAQGRLVMDNMPSRSVVQVLAVDDAGDRVYVADSANSATAMATGVVTSRGRIATAAGSSAHLATIIEMAEASGLRTGLVTTSSVTDATPASFVAHMSIRTCESPESIKGSDRYGISTPPCSAFLKASGGPGSISEQIAVSGVDVVLGGGYQHFDMPTEAGEESVLDLARGSGFHIIDNAKGLAAAPQGVRLLGLFAASHLPVLLRGENGRAAESPTPSWANRLHRYLGSVEQPAAMRCEPNPGFAATPRLAELTATALERLNGDSGFFLMVESASIDKQSHERKPCGSIGEVQQLDEALAVATDFAERHPDTLVLVTADHGHAAQLVPATSLFADFGIPVYTPGKIARLRTDEGGILAVNYATNNFPYEEHSGVNVPLFTNETGRELVSPMVTQPQIFEIMHSFLMLDSGDEGRMRQP